MTAEKQRQLESLTTLAGVDLCDPEVLFHPRVVQLRQEAHRAVMALTPLSPQAEPGDRYEIREKGGTRRVLLIDVMLHPGEGTQVPGVAGWATVPPVPLDDHGRVCNADGSLATRIRP